MSVSPAPEGFRLSQQQELLWRLQPAAPGARFVAQCRVPLLSGGPSRVPSGVPTGIDGAQLRRELVRLVERYEILRTWFYPLPDVAIPLQVIEEQRELSLVEQDLRSLEAAALAERLQVIETEAARPFDLEHEPLLRAALLHLPAGPCLLLTAAAAVADGATLLQLAEQVTRRLSSDGDAGTGDAGDGEEDEEALQYVDFGEWQQEILSDEETEEGRAFWQRRLAELPAPRRLAGETGETGEEEAADGIGGYHRATVALDAGALAAATEGAGVAERDFLLAAWAAWLHRMGGGEGLALGLCSDGRKLDALHGAVGPYAVVLPLILELERGVSVAELAATAAAAVAEAHGWEECFAPLALLGHAGSDAATPVPWTFAYRDLAGGVTLDSLRAGSVWQDYHGGQLGLEVLRTSRGLELWLHLDATVYAAADAERWAESLATLLADAAARPRQDLDDLQLVGPLEALALARLERATSPARPACRIHDLIGEQAARVPEQPAVVDGSDTPSQPPLSYGELWRRAGQLAHYLRRRGVGPDMRVGLCLGRTSDMVVGLLGILRAGAAYVPLDPEYPDQRLEMMVAETDSPLLLTVAELASQLSQLIGSGQQLLCLDRDWPRIERESPEPAVAGSEAHPAEAHPAAAPADDDAHPDNLAYVIYTSGSTGKPKGVLVSHRNLVHSTRARLDYYGARHDDAQPGRFLLLSSFAFDSSIAGLFGTLCQGATLVLVQEAVVRDAPRLAAAVERHQVAHSLCLPSLYRGVLDAARAQQLETLRAVIVAGEALPATLLAEHEEACPQAVLYNEYGPTEGTVWSTVHAFARGAREVSIGRALDGVCLRLLNARLRRLPLGVVGEIHLGGGGLARGYLQRPRQTAERFVPDPFADQAGARLYRTGDLARLDAQGDLEFLGRDDAQVKIRGYRIELGEIEAVLSEHPGLAEVAIAALPTADPATSEGDELRLVAWIRPAEDTDAPAGTSAGASTGASTGATVTVDELRRFLGRRLPEYMLPAVFVPLAQFPRTPNGKIDRAALPAPEEATALRGEYTPPRGELETRVAEVWAEVLGLSRVGRDENFFHLGGHSLVATQAAARLAESLPIALTVLWIFEQPTVAQLAERIAQEAPPVDEGETSGPSSSLASSPIPPRPSEAPAVLSFAQQRLWWLDRLDPGNLQYNVALSHYWSGPLDVAALAYGLRRVYERHEALRTTFTQVDDQPLQVIASRPRVELPLLDLSALAAAPRQQEVLRLARAEARRPFDLERGPLLRTVLVRLDGAEHALLLTMHHIVSDGVSMSILGRELGYYYNARLEGTAGADAQAPPEPAPPPIQYADFAAWQRRWLSGEVLEQQLAYWRHQLQATPVLDLPTDRPRPPRRRLGGGNSAHRLPAGLLERVETLARQHDATAFMVLLTAYAALLRQLSGQRDFAVGSPIAGRDRPEVQELIGFFVNMLVLRAELPDDPAFTDALAMLRQVCLEAYGHQHLPFEKLVEELEPERSLRFTPLFQAAFVLQPAAVPLTLNGLDMRPLVVDRGAAKFDLTLLLVPQPGEQGLQAVFEYDPALFDASTTARWLRRYETLLEAVLAQPAAPLSTLHGLSAAERHALVHEWGRPSCVDVPCASAPSTRAAAGVTSALELFYRQVEARPHAVALHLPSSADNDDGCRVITYAALAQHAWRLAHALRARGVTAESVVALGLEPGPEQVVAILAVLAAGGAYLPLDPSDPSARLAAIVEDAGAELVLVRGGQGDQQRGNLPATLPSLAVDDFDALAQMPAQPPALPRGAQLAYVIYTSGSTGRPKGVLVRHHELLRLLTTTEPWFAFGGGDVWTLFHSYAFDFSVWEIWGALAYGGRLVVVPYWLRRQPEALYDLLVRERVTVLNQTPSAFQQLAAVPAALARPAGGATRAGASAADALRWVIFGGEGLSAAAVTPWLQARGARQPCLVNMYGITETTVHVTFQPLALDDFAGAEPPIGHTLPDLGVVVASPLAGLDGPGIGIAGMGVAGEGLVRGAGLARGYLRRPALTAARFVPDPWSPEPGQRLYRSGDLLRRRADGRLEHLGRIDAQVKVRGHRIELGEIEFTLRQLPDVEHAAVVALGDAAGGQRLVAYVVVAAAPSSGPVSGRDLRTALEQHLPAHMVPAAFVLLDELPLTSQGKLDRRALPSPEEAAAVPSQDFVPPVSDRETQVAEVYREVLGLGREGQPGEQRVGREDDFFDLGGHSLLATRVLARLRAASGVELPLRQIFETPTVRGLAAALDVALEATAGRATAVAPLVPVPRDQPLPLSLAQQRLWFLYRLEPDSPAYNIPWAVQLDGVLDAAALQLAFDVLVRRHEVLRTGFTEVAGEPRQVIRPPARVPIAWIDVQALQAADRQREGDRWMSALAAQPFDLEREAPMRIRVLRWQSQRHLVLLNLHHIVADGWSLQVLSQEFSLLYEHARENPSLATAVRVLPPLPIQYADYAVWQRRVLSTRRLERELGWWRDYLEDAPPLLELPTDHPRPRLQTSRAGSVRSRAGGDVRQGLDSLCRQQGATLFMGLCTVFSALLGRLSGQLDVVLGSPVAGRQHPEVEGLIGFFVNTMVVRCDLGGDPTLVDLLGQQRGTVLTVQEHLDVPFERVVEELAPERNMSHAPVVQVVLSVHHGGQRAELPRLTGQVVSLPAASAKFDWILTVGDAADRLSFHADYNADLFDATTMLRFLATFQRLLAGWLQAPRQTLSQISLLSPAERQQLALEWNDTEGDWPRDTTLHVLFDAWAARTPQAPALAEGEATWTYAQLSAASDFLAGQLRARGVTAEVPVGLCMDRSAAFVLAALAVLKAGGVYVPLDPAYPAQRLERMVEDSGLTLLLTRAGDALPLLLPQPGERVDVDVEALVAAAEAGSPALALDGTLSAATAAPMSGAYIMYTSGSTGRPKGVLVHHRAICRLVLGGRYVDFEPGDRVGFGANTAFDGSTFEIWGALLNGGCLVVLPWDVMLSPAALRTQLQRRDIGVLFLSTALFHEMARQESTSFQGLRTVVAGGEAAEPSLFDEVATACPETRLINGYGPTESTTFATALHVRAALPGRRVPIGRPIADTSAWVVDRWYRLAATGVVGELWLGGDGLARGYVCAPALSADKFRPHAFGCAMGERLYRTGDLVRWRADGLLDCLGRADHQIKLRGFRIELTEIEALLLECPEVAEAVVLAQQEAASSQIRLVSYVVAAPVAAQAGPGADAERLRESLHALLQRQLPEYMVPQSFVFLDALPLTPNLKVDRRALPDVGAEAEAPRAFAAPETPTEEALAELWAEILEVTRVGRQDNFFDLGGHSLLAMRVAARVPELLGVELPLRQLFEAETLAVLADWIDARGTSAALPSQAAPLQTRPPLQPVARDRPLPVSLAQQRLWFLYRLAPDSPAYNMPWAVRLGDLDRAALAHSLNALVARHETLRTRFGERDGEAVQLIGPAREVAIEWRDLGDLDPAQRRHACEQQLREAANRPFDLESEDLLRVVVLRLAPDEHVMLLNLHHIIADGRSLEILNHELQALYDGARSGTPVALPELPIQYADYAQWQRRVLTPERLQRELAWWRQRLEGAPPLLELPADRPRPRHTRPRSGSVRVVHPAGSWTALSEAASSQGATPFMALGAVFAALLARLSGQRDIVFGSPVAGRGRPEVEDLIGFFVNTLVLRSDLRDDPDLPRLWSQVRERVLAAQEHLEVPFERVVEELAPRRDPGYAPIFQVMYSLHPAPAGPRRGDVLTVPGTVAKFDLILTQSVEGDRLLSHAEYNAELFDATTLARALRQLGRLLGNWLAAPGLALSAVPLLSPAERQQLAVEWNDTRAAWPRGRTLPELFAQQVARQPQAPAVESAGRTLSYAQLDAAANHLAHELLRRGVGPEVPVGLAVARSPEFVVGALAILKAGGFYVPLDPTQPLPRLQAMVQDSGLHLLLAAGGELASQELTSLEGVERLVIERPLSEEPLSEEPLPEGPASGPLVPAPATSVAYVMYTSGSTGRPKGVVVDHQAICRLVLGGGWLQVSAEDRLAFAANTAFDASTFEIWGALLHGACTVVLPSEVLLSPQALAREVAAHRISVLFLTTALFQETARQAPTSLAGLRCVLAGGESADPRLFERVRQACPDLCLLHAYGPTESTTFATLYPVPPRAAAWRLPIGRAIADTTLWLVDRRARLVPSGVLGELWIGGAGLARGYLGAARQSAEKFVPHAWSQQAGERLYRTGDLVRWLPEGNLDFVGRADHQIKLRGFRIELAEIEALLLQQPQVAEAVVVLRRGEAEVENALEAFLVPAAVSAAAGPAGTAGPAGKPDVEQLRHVLQAQLPAHMVPSHIQFLESLPLTPSGKIDRAALLAAAGGQRQVAAFEAPASATEQALAQLWQDILGVPRVGRGDNFFDLGGHSLLAMRITSRVRQQLGGELPLRRLFEADTLADLAAWIETQQHGDEAQPVLERIERDGPVPVSLAQQRLWFLYRLDPSSATYNMPLAVRLQGPLDAVALVRSFAALVARHEVLRTRFGEVDGEPVQLVEPVQLQGAEGPGEVDLGWLDLTRLAAADRQREGQARAAAAARQPFDLERGPAFRVRVLRHQPDEHLLLVNLHHIVADGWSLQLLRDEFTRLYEALRAGRPADLPPLPVQYADYAQWQRCLLSPQRLQQELQWWRQALDGAALHLDLPADRVSATSEEARGGAVGLRWPESLRQQLEAFGQQHEATPFMVLSALFAALLARLTGQDDVLLGAPVAGRHHPDVEGLIGFFVNTMVLRGRFHHDPGFSDLLVSWRDATLAVQEHLELPFDRLVEELAPQRRLGRAPLVQAVLSYHRGEAARAPAGQSSLTGKSNLAGSGVALPVTSAKFDLTLALAEDVGAADQGLSLQADFNADLFYASSVARWLHHLQHLAQRWLHSPERPLSAISLLSGPELHQLVVEHQDTDAPWPRQQTLPALVAHWVVTTPDAPAIDTPERVLSYAELDVLARDLAVRLRQRGVGPGTAVGLSMDRSAEFVVAALAVLQVGAFYVPLDPTYPPERLELIVADSGVALVLGRPGEGPRLAVERLDVDLSTVSSAASVMRPEAPRTAHPTDLAYVLYTSGSTGRPKGVMIDHRAICRLVLGGGYVELSADDRFAFATNTAFDPATFEIWGALLNGGCLVVLPREVLLQPPALARELAQRRVSVLFLATALFHEIARQVPAAFEHLKATLVGGEAVDPRRFNQVLAAAPRTCLLNGYGPTESTVFAATYRMPTVLPNLHRVPIGRALTSTSLWAVDRRRRLVPTGVVAELWIGGAGLARGYHRSPWRTAEKFVPHAFGGDAGERLYRSGDLVRWLPDGNLDFLGRVDHQIKLRGFRIELAEIEALLAAQPEVTEVAVVLHRGADGAGQFLAAYVTSDRTEARSELAATLRRRLQRQVPAHMVPHSLQLLEAFPLTPNRKIDRAALPAPELDEVGQREAYEPPATPIEELVAQLWQEMLDLPRVGRHDNFFALGGHSLGAIRLLARLQEQVAVELQLRQLFRAPTVSELAALVEMALEGGPDDLGLPPADAPIALTPGAAAPLFFAHPVGGHIFHYGALAQRLRDDFQLLAFAARGLDGEAAPRRSIETMAAAYVEALLERDPAGPYLLGGWSLGGLIAFEMAHQLQAAGHRVKALILVDSRVPTSALPADPGERGRLRAFALDLGLRREDLDPELSPLAELELEREFELEGELELIRHAAQARGLLPADLDAATLLRFYRVFGAHLEAQAAYQPAPCTVDALLLRAADGAPADAPADLGWGPLLPAGVELQTVPGDHWTLLQEPHVGVLFERLIRYLGTRE